MLPVLSPTVATAAGALRRGGSRQAHTLRRLVSLPSSSSPCSLLLPSPHARRGLRLALSPAIRQRALHPSSPLTRPGKRPLPVPSSSSSSSHAAASWWSSSSSWLGAGTAVKSVLRRGYRSVVPPPPRPRLNLPQGDAIVYALIGANVLVFGAWTYASGNRKWERFMLQHFTVSPFGVLEEGRVHTLVTSMFSHRSFTHLLVNCVTLYFFGAEAAMILGAKTFLNMYLAGGVVSSLCCVAWPFAAKRLDIPAAYRTSKYTVALGASGAINAAVMWSILTFPTRSIYIYMVLPVPAALVGVLFLVKDMAGLYQGGGGEANAGHLGGAVVGAACYFLLRRGRF